MPWIAGALVTGGLGLVASDRAASKQVGAANRATDLTEAQYKQSRADLMPWIGSGTVALDQLNYLLGLGAPPGSTAPTAPTREQFQGGNKPVYLFDKPSTGIITGYTPGQFDQSGYDAAWQQYQNELAKYQAQLEGDSQYGSLLDPFSLDKFEESPAYQFNLDQGLQAINKAAASRGDYYAPATLQDVGKFSQGLASNEFQNAYNNYNTDQENVWRRLFGVSESGRGAAAGVGELGSRAAGAASANTIGAGNAQAAGIIGGANALAQGFGGAYNAYLQQQILNNMPTYGWSGGGGGGYTP